MPVSDAKAMPWIALFTKMDRLFDRMHPDKQQKLKQIELRTEMGTRVWKLLEGQKIQRSTQKRPMKQAQRNTQKQPMKKTQRSSQKLPTKKTQRSIHKKPMKQPMEKTQKSTQKQPMKKMQKSIQGVVEKLSYSSWVPPGSCLKILLRILDLSICEE